MGKLVEYVQNVDRINGWDAELKDNIVIGEGKGKPLELDPDDANTKRLLAARAIVTKELADKVNPVGEADPAAPPANAVGAGDPGVAVIPDDDADRETWVAYATNPNGGALGDADVKGKTVPQIKKLLS